ncbi:TetR/AcrR family transcriptional regulator [Streptomyces sp. NBC_00487]|uniref:TetR/AcrR family transcriptional regulator n=1 Tax=unclassified Streptomyces TaxID=2593676 RepID=UPI002E16CB42|nr:MULTISPECIES: TetR/AcrR family transcriptional regulator [unclassified Streptomyces]
MARMALRERREELIAAAIRVVTREGVAKTTTRSIVREAGMTLGVFHYCFDSREDLLEQVITRITDDFVIAFRQACAGETELRPAVEKSLSAFWDGVQAGPGEHLAGHELAHYALRQAGMEKLARRQYRHYLDVHEDLVTDIAAKTGVRWTVPGPVLARYLNSVLDGLTMCWLIDRDTETSRAVLDLTGRHLETLAVSRTDALSA